MSIKNAFKILFNRFEIVGEILLFIVIMLLVFCGLGAIFVQPIIQAAVDSNLNNEITQFYSSLLNSEGNIVETFINGISEIMGTVRGIFVSDRGLILKTTLVPIAFFVTFNFLFHMYELPLCKVLEARMSSNAKISLLGNTISLSGKSAIFALVRLLFVIVADAVFFLIIWGSYKLLVLASAPLMIPFIELLLLLLYLSLRKCFMSTWVQHMTIGETKIFRAFAQSVKDGFGHFRITFSGYFVCYLIVFVLNFLMALLTFGVGLIVSIPVSLMYFAVLEMTAYYKWNNKRYYLDGQRIIGSEQEQLTEKLD